jgi:hypothetical protein
LDWESGPLVVTEQMVLAQILERVTGWVVINS